MIRVRVRQRVDSPHLQLAWNDPLTGRIRTRSAGTEDWQTAERAAALLEIELQQRTGQRATGWDLFRRRFEDEHLPSLSAASGHAYRLAMNKFETLIGHPNDLASITSSVLSDYAAKVRKQGVAESSVATHLRHLRSALGWASRVGLILAAPRVVMPRSRSTRGRALSFGEVLRYFSALRRLTPPEHRDALLTLVKCCWLGGLRFSEALALSHDSPPVRVDLARDYPAIVWTARGQKSRKDQVVPITPDFARFLRGQTPAGHVVARTLPRRKMRELLAEAGQDARILVAPKKHATAHDFRRTFGTRWAMRVHPLTLKTLMRHSSLETTLRYYVDLDSDAIAKQLWSVDAAVDAAPLQRQKPKTAGPGKRERT